MTLSHFSKSFVCTQLVSYHSSIAHAGCGEILGCGIKGIPPLNAAIDVELLDEMHWTLCRLKGLTKFVTDEV